jgi:hypothetical protein
MDNLLTPLSGKYEIRIAVQAVAKEMALRNLTLDIYKNAHKGHMISRILAVWRLYDKLQPKVRISRVFTLLGMSQADISKINDSQIFDSEVLGPVEEWHVSTDTKDILRMGDSRYFSSCYRNGGGYHNLARSLSERKSGTAIVSQQDINGEYISRFILYCNDKHYSYPGASFSHTNLRLEDSPQYPLLIGNIKGNITSAKAIAVVKKILEATPVKRIKQLT